MDEQFSKEYEAVFSQKTINGMQERFVKEQIFYHQGMLRMSTSLSTVILFLSIDILIISTLKMLDWSNYVMNYECVCFIMGITISGFTFSLCRQAEINLWQIYGGSHSTCINRAKASLLENLLIRSNDIPFVGYIFLGMFGAIPLAVWKLVYKDQLLKKTLQLQDESSIYMTQIMIVLFGEMCWAWLLQELKHLACRRMYVPWEYSIFRKSLR